MPRFDPDSKLGDKANKERVRQWEKADPEVVQEIKSSGFDVPDDLSVGEVEKLLPILEQHRTRTAKINEEVQSIERATEARSLRRQRTPEETAARIDPREFSLRRSSDPEETSRSMLRNERGVISRGLEAGARQVKASIPATEALIRGAVGDEEGAIRAAESARDEMDRAAIIAPQTSLQDVIEGRGKFSTWAGGMFGQQAPVLATFIGTGGVGGLGAKLLQRQALRGVQGTIQQTSRAATAARKQLESVRRASRRERLRNTGQARRRRQGIDVDDSARTAPRSGPTIAEARDQTARIAEKRDQALALRDRLIERTPFKVALGQSAGAAGTGIGFHAGDTSQWLLDPEASGTVQQRALSGLGAATLAALTEIAPTIAVLRNLGVGTKATHMTSKAMETHSATRRIATGAGKQTVLEAQAEVGAEIIKDVSYSFVNENKELFTSDDMWKYFESAAAGGLIGGTLGGLTSARPSDFGRIFQMRAPGPAEEAFASRQSEREMQRKSTRSEAEDRRAYEEMGLPYPGEFEGFDSDQREQRGERSADVGLSKLVGNTIGERFDIKGKEATQLGQMIRMLVDPDAYDTVELIAEKNNESVDDVVAMLNKRITDAVGQDSADAVLDEALEVLASAESNILADERRILKSGQWLDSETGEYRTLSDVRRNQIQANIEQREARLGGLLANMSEEAVAGITDVAADTSPLANELRAAQERGTVAARNPDPEVEEGQVETEEDAAVESGFGGIETLETSPRFPLAGEGPLAQADQNLTKRKSKVLGGLFKRGARATQPTKSARKLAEKLGDTVSIVPAGEALAQAIADRGLSPDVMIEEAHNNGGKGTVKTQAQAREYLNQFDAIVDQSPPSSVSGKDDAVLTPKDLKEATEDRKPSAPNQVQAKAPDGKTVWMNMVTLTQRMLGRVEKAATGGSAGTRQVQGQQQAQTGQSGTGVSSENIRRAAASALAALEESGYNIESLPPETVVFRTQGRDYTVGELGVQGAASPRAAVEQLANVEAVDARIEETKQLIAEAKKAGGDQQARIKTLQDTLYRLNQRKREAQNAAEVSQLREAERLSREFGDKDDAAEQRKKRQKKVANARNRAKNLRKALAEASAMYANMRSVKNKNVDPLEEAKRLTRKIINKKLTALDRKFPPYKTGDKAGRRPPGYHEIAQPLFALRRILDDQGPGGFRGALARANSEARVYEAAILADELIRVADGRSFNDKIASGKDPIVAVMEEFLNDEVTGRNTFNNPAENADNTFERFGEQETLPNDPYQVVEDLETRTAEIEAQIELELQNPLLNRRRVSPTRRREQGQAQDRLADLGKELEAINQVLDGYTGDKNDAVRAKKARAAKKRALRALSIFKARNAARKAASSRKKRPKSKTAKPAPERRSPRVAPRGRDLKPDQAGVELPRKTQYAEKDQRKARLAVSEAYDRGGRNLFIGRGSENSSTRAYAEAYGDRANVGEYTANDAVFVSAEGNRKNRIKPDFDELKKATDAGAVIIIDNESDRNRPYNVGEREVADFLRSQGYEPGVQTEVWYKSTEIRSTEGVSPEAIKILPANKRNYRAVAEVFNPRLLKEDLFDTFVENRKEIYEYPEINQKEIEEHLGEVLDGAKTYGGASNEEAAFIAGGAQQAYEIFREFSRAYNIPMPALSVLYEEGIFASYAYNAHRINLPMGLLEVLADPTADATDKAAAIEVIYHELGHALQGIMLENTPAPQLRAIKAEYDAWRKEAEEMIKQGKNPQISKRRYTSGRTQTTYAGVNKDYILDFAEWFADVTAGVMTGKGIEMKLAATKPVHQYANILRDIWTRMVKKIWETLGIEAGSAQDKAPTLEAFLLGHIQAAPTQESTPAQERKTIKDTKRVVESAKKGRVPPSQRETETEYAQEIINGLGLEGVTVEVIDTAEAAQLAKKGTNLNEMDGLAFPQLNKKTGEVHVKIWVNDSRVPNGNQRMGVLHHELGHAVVDSLTHRIKENDARAIWKAYEQWAVENNRGGASLKKLAMSKRSLLNMMNYREGARSQLGELSQAEQENVLDFHEWFADQIGRWIETSDKPRGVIEKFFKNIADKLKELVAKLGRGSKPAFAVRVTLDNMWNAKAPHSTVRQWNLWKRVGDQSEVLSGKLTENLKGVLKDIREQMNSDSNVPPERVVAGVEHARSSPFSIEAFFGTRDVIAAKLTSEERRLLGRAFMNPKVRRQMYNILRRMGHDADGILDDPYSTITVGYMMWQAGKLTVTPGGGKAFNAVAKFMNDVTGRVSELDQAYEIMNAIQDDRLAGREPVLQTNAKKGSNLAKGAYTLGSYELTRIRELIETRGLTTMSPEKVAAILGKDRIFGGNTFSQRRRMMLAQDITNKVFTKKFVEKHEVMSDYVLDPDKVFSVQKVIGNSPVQQKARAIVEVMEGAGNWFRDSIGKLVLPEALRARWAKNIGLTRFSESLVTDVLQEGGREGYLNIKERQRGTWDARFNRILENLNDKEQRELRDFIQGKRSDASPKVRKARKEYQQMMRAMHKYAKNAGLPIGDSGVDYFPWVFDPITTEQKASQLFEAWSNARYREKWVEVAKRHQDSRLNEDGTDFASDSAYEAYVLGWINGIVARNNGLADAAMPDQQNLDPAPHVGALNQRELAFLNDPDLAPQSDRDLLSSLFSDDFAGSMAVYIDQMTKRVEYARAFGHRGEKFKQMVAQAKQAGASSEDIQLMHTMLHSAMGTLGLEVAPFWKKVFEPVNKALKPVLDENNRPFPTREAANKKLGSLKVGGKVVEYNGGFAVQRDVTGDPKKFRDLFGWLVTYQNIRILAFAAFTNLADVAGVAFRTGNFRMTMQAYGEGLRDVRRLIQDRKLPRAERAARRSSAERLAEEIGVIVQASIGDVIGQFYGGNQFSGTARKWNDKFFRWNGMEYLTRTTRVMATAAGSEFIAYHAQRARQGDSKSAEALVELGLDFQDVRVDINGRLQLMSLGEIDAVLDGTSFATGRDVRDARAAGVQVTGEALEVARDDRVRQALYRMVDESVLRPTATQRPSWMNDPNWQLFSHLKAFMYTYHERVLRRAYGRAAQGSYGPMLLMSTYVAAIMAADLLREYVQHGPEGDERKERWGWRDRLVDGIHRSGTPGMFVLPMDMMKTHEYGSSQIMQMAGPFGSQVEEWYRVLSGSRSFSGALSNSLPASQAVDAVGAYGSYALGRAAGEDTFYDVPLIRPEIRDAIKGDNED